MEKCEQDVKVKLNFFLTKNKYTQKAMTLEAFKSKAWRALKSEHKKHWYKQSQIQNFETEWLWQRVKRNEKFSWKFIKNYFT